MPSAPTHSDPAPAAVSELWRFEDEVHALERGGIDPADFRKFRLQNGVYGIRQSADRHMIRIRVPLGILTPEQLNALASLAEQFAPSRQVHLTTRQDIQIHQILRPDLPSALRHIHRCGLTTREAAGNVVRNVTACPLTGVSPGEAFDVTPYAQAVAAYFLRNPLTQDLPRKFKIAFEGCPTDHARTPIHDLGAVAVLSDGGQRGFRIYVGGGLGAAPRCADLLEPFTPAEWLIPTCEAVLRVFDRHGNRDNKLHARLKFLIKQWGAERFRAAVLTQRRTLLAVRSGAVPMAVETDGERPPLIELPPAPAPAGADFWAWRATNVIPQEQPGWFVVTVRCPLGDLTAGELRAIGEASRRYCGGRMRLSIEQNILLRWVPEATLPALHRDLSAAGLAHPGAHTIADITRCPGADTCTQAITHSRGLAEALEASLTTGELARLPEVNELTVKISGCPNSCGQHHIADIGFYGASKRIDGHDTPHYLLLVGGGTAEGEATFAKPLAQIPARRVPEAVRALLVHFHEQRLAGEAFTAFTQRVGTASLRALVEPFRSVPPFTEAPEYYEDLGAPGRRFIVQVGDSECAV